MRHRHRHSLDNRYLIMKLLKAAVVLIVLPLAFIGFGFAVKALWNWLMPTIFGLTTITFWQAWGLLALSWILSGVIRIGGQPRHFRHRMAERWMKMTPEEREQFRAQIHDHWHRHHHDEPPTQEPTA